MTGLQRTRSILHHPNWSFACLLKLWLFPTQVHKHIGCLLYTMNVPQTTSTDLSVYEEPNIWLFGGGGVAKCYHSDFSAQRQAACGTTAWWEIVNFCNILPFYTFSLRGDTILVALATWGKSVPPSVFWLSRHRRATVRRTTIIHWSHTHQLII